MNYQPIQMPQPAGLSEIADMLFAARRHEDQMNQQRAELILRQQDSQSQDTHRRAIEHDASEQLRIQRENADALNAQRMSKGVQEYTAALDAEHPDLAKQIAKAYGIPFVERSVQLHPSPADQLMAPSLDRGAPTGTAPADLDLDKADRSSPSYDPKAVQANEDAIAQYTASQFQPAGMVQSPRKTMYEVGGEQYDPEQRRQAETAKRGRYTEQVRGAFGPLGYGDEAAALAGAGTDGKDFDISGLISKRMDRDTQREATEAQKAETRRFQAEQAGLYRDTPDDRMDRTRLSATMGYEGRKGIAQAMGGGKADSNTLAAVKYVDDTIQKAARNSGYVKLRESTQMLDNAEAQINSNSGSGQFGALMLIGRAMRGGAATEFVSEEERKHLSGIVGRIEGYAQALENGQYSDEQRNSVREEIRAGKLLLSQLQDRSSQALAATLRDDPAIANLKGTANAKYRSYMSGMGRRDAPPLFPGETNNVPALGANVVKGGGTYVAPDDAAPAQSRVKSVSGPLGAFRDDPNNEAPLAEDADAEELAAPVAARKAGKAQNRRRVDTLTGQGATEAQIRERAQMAGSDPDRAVARARKLGLIP